MQNSSKKESKNTKALFSVVCLCIISLGLIVYFSTNTRQEKNTVNEPTTIVETTEVQHAVTVEQTEKATTKQTTTKKAKPTTTQPSTMEMLESNTPYKSFYKYPLSESVIRGYSEELSYDETMGDYRAHSSVDFSGAEGDSVIAINDGLVMDVYVDNMYGSVIVIDHGGKLVVKYCGLKSANVKKGSMVAMGEALGTLGAIPCESDLGAHLHFEAKLDGKTVNPLDVMGKTE